MNIVTTRRISQIFFFIVFIWFCLVTTIGDQWWQLRGWPVNWIIQLDPLLGLATLLSTRTLFAGLLWGLATVVLTIIFGRFFCGWLCPFGAIHQFVGYIANRKKKAVTKKVCAVCLCACVPARLLASCLCACFARCYAAPVLLALPLPIHTLCACCLHSFS